MPKRAYREIPKLTPKEIERFSARVDKGIYGPNGDCWKWTGCVNKDGYGCVTVRWVYYIASRVAYRIFSDHDPKQLRVCHHCDWPPCVNPAHLFLGTNKDNAEDRNRKGRQAKGEKSAPKSPARGLHNGNWKLTDDARFDIIKLFSKNQFSKAELGRQFRVDAKVITQITTSPYWLEQFAQRVQSSVE